MNKLFLSLTTVFLSLSVTTWANDEEPCTDYQGKLLNESVFQIHVDGADCYLAKEWANSWEPEYDSFAATCKKMSPRAEETYGVAKKDNGRQVSTEIVTATITEKGAKVIRLVRGGGPGRKPKVLCDERPPIDMPAYNGAH